MTDFPAHPNPITGKHVSVILVGFFLVIIVVNAVMLTYALKSFSGLVVENSYVASQTFDKDVDSAKAQPIQSWSIRIVNHAPLTIELADSKDELVKNSAFEIEVSRPTSREPAFVTEMTEIQQGRYVAAETLDPGQWSARLTLSDGQSRTVKLMVPEQPE